MKKIGLLCFLVLLCALPGSSYRFICNGMLANGDERSDECGICDQERAARWDSPRIEVVVDESRLPKNISKSDWRKVVNNSLDAWANVSGSNLQFIKRNEANLRQFGANDDLHEIFWITDRQEWRRLIGSGEFGTLGATMPRYVCGDFDGKRDIFDADLVLNGMPHINWQMDCKSEDCISPQTTLVHELGHFFGLDHPCLMCSSSIMSARAGFDLTYPVFDDMEGLRALYPDNSIGGFGFPCDSQEECHNNGLCINDGSHRYCSKNCSLDQDCELGAICQARDGKKVCAFVDDEAAGGRSEGDGCMNKPCSDPLVCAGASDYNYFCFMPCGNQNDCKANQTCVQLDVDLSLCVVVKNQGETCDHRELCDDNLYCVFDTLSSGFCRAPCSTTEAPTTGCPDSLVCQIFKEGVEICVPEEHGLNLDDNQDGFGQEKGTGAGNKAGRGKSQGGEAPGCQMANSSAVNHSIWLILLFLGLMKKWRSSLSFGRR
jgi:hypothetical protein